MKAKILKLTLQLFITYLCYLNLISILTVRRFKLSSQYLTFLYIPYGTEKILLIEEATVDRRFPALAAALACNCYDLLLWMLLHIIAKRSEHRLHYLMFKIYWSLKFLWIMFYIYGFVFLFVRYHQLYLLTEGLNLKSSEELLFDYKLQFLWQSFVFAFTMTWWSDNHRLIKKYLKVLRYKYTFELYGPWSTANFMCLIKIQSYNVADDIYKLCRNSFFFGRSHLNNTGSETNMDLGQLHSRLSYSRKFKKETSCFKLKRIILIKC